ncbi:hypothetical protein [Klebsiella michiganensis]|uniref:hypothetical protein n=1 Tax=Klebsiella michiganensis TaxID=1134687 RepID=UPI0012B78134|nr:hypothetical protein [Klebsiella michiganensis]
MFFNMLNNKQKKRLFINQVNVFYNYSLGFEVHSVDLLKTAKEGANKQVISSQADSLIKISRIWADFFPANTSNQPI